MQAPDRGRARAPQRERELAEELAGPEDELRRRDPAGGRVLVRREPAELAVQDEEHGRALLAGPADQVALPALDEVRRADEAAAHVGVGEGDQLGARAREPPVLGELQQRLGGRRVLRVDLEQALGAVQRLERRSAPAERRRQRGAVVARGRRPRLRLESALDGEQPDLLPPEVGELEHGLVVEAHVREAGGLDEVAEPARDQHGVCTAVRDEPSGEVDPVADELRPAVRAGEPGDVARARDDPERDSGAGGPASQLDHELERVAGEPRPGEPDVPAVAAGGPHDASRPARGDPAADELVDRGDVVPLPRELRLARVADDVAGDEDVPARRAGHRSIIGDPGRPSTGRPGRRRGSGARGGLDVLVEAEHVRRVVLVLQRREPGVCLGAVGRARRAGVAEEVRRTRVRSTRPAADAVHRARPLDVRVGLRRGRASP